MGGVSHLYGLLSSTALPLVPDPLKIEDSEGTLLRDRAAPGSWSKSRSSTLTDPPIPPFAAAASASSLSVRRSDGQKVS